MRLILRTFALAVALPMTFAYAQSTTDLQVQTTNGIVEGKQEGPVRAFLGIPYAAPPIGDLRWKAPAPGALWKGVRQAKEFGARCMQTNIYEDMVFRDPGPSEDCLNLNVWTPAKSPKDKLPVMVWIYGGGFVAGASSEPRQDGAILAQQNVVVVSMNYRLGIFGFFVLPELVLESGRGSTGNYGLLDQVAALQWVKRNIAAFGGDPGNVTIFGESAGSFSVSSLMASPQAKGLIHKAIGESGGAFSRTLHYKSLDESSKDNSAFAKKALGTASLKELRAIPADKILAAASKQEEGDDVGFGPNVDGYFLPKSVNEIFAAGQQNDIPLIAGWNHDEGNFAVLSAKPPLTAASVKELAQKEFGENASAFLKVYPADDDQTAIRSWEDFAGDRFIGFGTWKWLEAQATTGKQPTYRYRFDLAPPQHPFEPPNAGAYHSAEIEYVFQAFGSKEVQWRDEDRALSSLMQKYWANFARTGNPNASGLPEWPQYKPKTNPQVMFLDAQSKAASDPYRDRYLFLTKVWDK